MQAPVQNPQPYLLSEQSDYAYFQDMRVPTLDSLLAQEGLFIADAADVPYQQTSDSEFYSAFSFQDKPASLENLRKAYTNAINASAVPGKYVQAYDLLFALISVDRTGNPIISEDDAAGLDLATWRLDRRVIDDWKPAPGVDEGAWVFLWGVAVVNQGRIDSDDPDSEDAYSRMVREYSKAQYRLRIGGFNLSVEEEAELDAKVQAASDAIARSILEDILNIPPLDGENRQPNPNHHLPSIDGIAAQDASAAARVLFTDEHVAGWAGNPFLLNVGHDDSYRKYILHDSEYEGDGNRLNTYDALALIRSMFDAADAVGYVTSFRLVERVFWDVVPHVPGASVTIAAAENDTNLFLENAFGTSFPEIDIVVFSNLVVGTYSTGQRLIGSDGDDFIQGGNGNDIIIAFEEDDLLTFGPFNIADGDDVLAGLGGNDTYISGVGNDLALDTAGVDTYLHGDGGELLIIRDIGGQGTLAWDDEVVASNDPEHVSNGTLGSATPLDEAGLTFVLEGEDGTRFVVTLEGISTADGSLPNLVIQRQNGNSSDRIIIEDFQEGDFGLAGIISLETEPVVILDETAQRLREAYLADPIEYRDDGRATPGDDDEASAIYWLTPPPIGVDPEDHYPPVIGPILDLMTGDDTYTTSEGHEWANGGSGSDTVVIMGSRFSSTVNLEAGYAVTGNFRGTRIPSDFAILENFENVFGGESPGYGITGTPGSNRYELWSGINTIDGRGGRDTLIHHDRAETTLRNIGPDSELYWDDVLISGAFERFGGGIYRAVVGDTVFMAEETSAGLVITHADSLREGRIILPDFAQGNYGITLTSLSAINQEYPDLAETVILEVGEERGTMFTDGTVEEVSSVPVPAYLQEYIEEQGFEHFTYVNASLSSLSGTPDRKILYIIDDIPSNAPAGGLIRPNVPAAGATLGILNSDVRVLFHGFQVEGQYEPVGENLYQLERYGQVFTLEDITESTLTDAALQERFANIGIPFIDTPVGVSVPISDIYRDTLEFFGGRAYRLTHAGDSIYLLGAEGAILGITGVSTQARVSTEPAEQAGQEETTIATSPPDALVEEGPTSPEVDVMRYAGNLPAHALLVLQGEPDTDVVFEFEFDSPVNLNSEIRFMADNVLGSDSLEIYSLSGSKINGQAVCFSAGEFIFVEEVDDRLLLRCRTDASGRIALTLDDKLLWNNEGEHRFTTNMPMSVVAVAEPTEEMDIHSLLNEALVEMEPTPLAAVTSAVTLVAIATPSLEESLPTPPMASPPLEEMRYSGVLPAHALLVLQGEPETVVVFEFEVDSPVSLNTEIVFIAENVLGRDSLEIYSLSGSKINGRAVCFAENEFSFVEEVEERLVLRCRTDASGRIALSLDDKLLWNNAGEHRFTTNMPMSVVAMAEPEEEADMELLLTEVLVEVEPRSLAPSG